MTQTASRFSRGERQGVGCIIGLAAPSGAGKTTSALRLARGLCADPGDDLNDPETLAKTDARIALADSERGRALHKCVAPGELPQPWRKGAPELFGFFHAPILAPFTPDNYREIIVDADEATDDAGLPRFRAIIIDSGSHEWDGDGGCHDLHDEELDKAVAAALARAKRANQGNEPSWWDEAEQREKLNLGAWKDPKKRHKRFVSRLLQCRAHLIICMRAEDKMRIETEKKEKRGGGTYTATTITAPKDMAPRDRWQPVCEKRLPYELLTSFVLSPDRPGVPIILKAEEAHRPMIDEERPIDEQLGIALAAWASGKSKDQMRPNSALHRVGPPSPPADEPDDFPGDRPPPGDLDPAGPIVIFERPNPGAPRSEWEAFAKRLVIIARAAPDQETRRRWRDLNMPFVLRESAQLAAWIDGKLQLVGEQQQGAA